MNRKRIPRPVSTVKLQDFDGELILYDSKKMRLLYLSQTAALVWRLCDGQRSIGDIIGLLQDAYPQKAADVARDVESVIGRFEDKLAIAYV